MPMFPRVVSQQDSASGLSRPGGAASRGSQQIAADPGQNWAAMESKLLRGVDDQPTNSKAKQLSGGGVGRQFFTKSSGGDTAAGLPKSPKAFSKRLSIDGGKGKSMSSGLRVSGAGANSFSQQEGFAKTPSATKARLFPNNSGSVKTVKMKG